MQMELAEGLNTEHGLTSIHKYEGSLSRFFSFKKENKVDKYERKTKQCEEDNIFNFQVFSVYVNFEKNNTQKRISAKHPH